MEAPSRPQVDRRQLRKSLLTWAVVGIVLMLVFRVGFDNIWREGVIRPMLNSLLFLYTYLGRSFFMAILTFTVFLRLLTWPLSIKQIRTQRMTTAIKPRMDELQKKYAGNRQKLVEEQQRLYKELGVNPMSGCLPTLVQFPIWIGLYQSITSILADTPTELLRLGHNMYIGFAGFRDVVPIQSRFLWLNLAQPDPWYVLPVLVGVTMYLQQKLMTQSAASDPQQASMNNTMQVMMPLMFAYFTTQFASGLALYFVISSVVGIAIQWFIERRMAPVASIQVPEIARADTKDRVSNGRKRQRRKKKR